MVWLHQGNHKGCNEGNPSVLKIVDFLKMGSALPCYYKCI